LSSSGRTGAERGPEGRTTPGDARSRFDPYEILGALQRRRVGFVVIGAFARVVHGTREVTEGIDITPSMRDDNLGRLEVALEDLGARDAAGSPLDLRDVEERVVEFETSAGELKIVPEPAGTRGYNDLRRRAQREPLGRGLRPEVASTDDLARMLGALGRDEDIERLLRLRRLMSLDHGLSRERGHGMTR
jgi:hypothetical protein